MALAQEGDIGGNDGVFRDRELTRPELGYLKQPYEVYPLEDFSAAQIARAAEEPGMYSAALVFSTKYDPQSPLFTLGPKSKAVDERFFGLHQDLQPAEIARRLNGTLVWEKYDQGQWVALIRFNRQFDARLEPATLLSAGYSIQAGCPILESFYDSRVGSAGGPESALSFSQGLSFQTWDALTTGDLEL